MAERTTIVTRAAGPASLSADHPVDEIVRVANAMIDGEPEVEVDDPELAAQTAAVIAALLDAEAQAAGEAGEAQVEAARR